MRSVLTASLVLLLLLSPLASAQEERVAIIGFVDVGVLLAELGKNRNIRQAQLVEEGNRSLRYLARLYPVDLVLQDVVYLDRRFDITSRLVTHSRTQSVDHTQPARSGALTRVGYLDRQRTARELKVPELGYVAIRKRVDLAVKSLAERFELDLVIEEAALCGCPIDITQDVILEAKGEQPDAGRLKALPRVAAKIGVVAADLLMKEAKGAPPPEEKDKLPAFLGVADDAVKSVAKTDGLDFVLQDAVFSSPKVDITSKVLDVIGRR
jgi:Skp family chaperone for outer membrane proteins